MIVVDTFGNNNYIKNDTTLEPIANIPNNRHDPIIVEKDVQFKGNVHIHGNLTCGYNRIIVTNSDGRINLTALSNPDNVSGNTLASSYNNWMSVPTISNVITKVNYKLENIETDNFVLCNIKYNSILKLSFYIKYLSDIEGVSFNYTIYDITKDKEIKTINLKGVDNILNSKLYDIKLIDNNLYCIKILCDDENKYDYRITNVNIKYEADLSLFI